ncbi:MAG TPA: hypothetical protein VF731_04280, partial [Solirubrobacterales bacterium]
GQRLRGDLAPAVGRRFRLELGAGHGLRFGLNRLRLLTYGEGGDYDVQTTSFRIPADRPLASAGPDRAARVGETVRLDGADSMPSPGQRGLAFSWRVLGSPSGQVGQAARSALRQASSAEPTFRPPSAGIWTLEVSVRAGSGGVSRDTVTVNAAPADPPIGASLETLASAGGAINVAGKPLEGTGAGGVTLSYGFLDRSNRMPATSCLTSVPRTGNVPATAAGVKTLEKLLADCPEDRYLLILDSARGVGGVADAVAGLLAKIGSGPLSAADRSALSERAFSAIGVPGAPAGGAFLNLGQQTSTNAAKPRRVGALSGYLEQGTATKEYGFVFPDYVSYNTHASSTATSNTMTIGANSYSATLPEGSAGFHLVIVDPASLRVLTEAPPAPWEEESDVNVAWPTATGNPAEDQKLLEGLAGYIRQNVFERPGLVFLQSIGNPKPTAPAWDEVAKLIEELGGSRTVFDELDGSGGYAFVGGAGVAGPLVSSVPLTRNPSEGQLSGVLLRTRRAGFTPGPTEQGSGAGAELLRIAFQPSQPFPAFASAGEKAADAYIARQLFGETVDPADVRAQYYLHWGVDWVNKNQQMKSEVPYPGEAKCGCKQAEFDAVKARLGQEITKLADVKQWIGRMEGALDPSQSAFNLVEISRKISEQVRPPDRPTTALGYEMLAGVFQLVSKASPEASGPASAAAAMMNFFAGIMTAGDGGPVLGEISSKTSELGSKLFDRFELARTGLNGAGMIVASDWGKLQALAKLATGAWRIDDPTVIRTVVNKSSKRWFYAELMKTAWVMWELPVGNAREWDCLVGNADAWATKYPFASEPESGQYRAATGIQSSLKPSTIVRALGVRTTFQYRKSVEDDSARPPAAELTNPLFEAANLSPESPKLGLYPQQFYERNFERASPPVSSGKFCDS